MDIVTQTGDSLDDLITMMSSSLSYLVRKSNFKPVNPALQVTQVNINSDSAEDLEEHTKELALDLVRKAKTIETLIGYLPKPDLQADHVKELSELQSQLEVANREYREGMEIAQLLHKDIENILKATLDNRQKMMAKLMDTT